MEKISKCRQHSHIPRPIFTFLSPHLTFIQQILLEHLLRVWHSVSRWEHSSEQNRKNSCPHQVYTSSTLFSKSYNRGCKKRWNLGVFLKSRVVCWVFDKMPNIYFSGQATVFLLKKESGPLCSCKILGHSLLHSQNWLTAGGKASGCQLLVMTS